jgi:hypothetical protein
LQSRSASVFREGVNRVFPPSSFLSSVQPPEDGEQGVSFWRMQAKLFWRKRPALGVGLIKGAYSKLQFQLVTLVRLAKGFARLVMHGGFDDGVQRHVCDI